MIIKGNRHNNGGKLASYMMNGEARKGERAELNQLKGFGEAATIAEAFRDLEIMAEATKADNALFHVQVRLPEHERLTPAQWEHTADRIEKRLGLTGQPRAIYFHVNDTTGERHMHIGFSLIDADTMTAKPVPFFKFRLKDLARELENEFDITRVKNERDGPILYAATKNEQQQAQRLGVDKDTIRNAIRACWERSDCGRSFDDALASEGMILAQGTRRDYVIIDHAGGLHALGKRILDVSAGQVRARLADLDREQMPTIEQAREFMLDLPRDRADKLTRELADVQAQIKAEHEYARRDPVRDEIQWQEVLDKAAIAKEKTERQFVEPRDDEKEKPRAAREQTQPGGREEKVWPINPPQHQSWPGFEKAASEATRDDRTENLRGPAAQVWTAWQQSDSAQAFAAALDDKGIGFAAVTGEEAYRSHREADFARAVGNYAPRFKEGEIVIVTEQRHEYRREGAIIEPPRIRRLDQSLADKFVRGLGGRDKLQGIDATLQISDIRAQQRAADREAIRLEKATDIRDFSRIIPASAKDSIRASAKVASSVLGGIGKGVDAVADGFASLFAPVLTPEQKLEGEITQQRREAEGEASIDYSRYTAERTQERRQQENEREAARQRQRDEERGRDR
jgi:hypothetical protein